MTSTPVRIAALASALSLASCLSGPATVEVLRGPPQLIVMVSVDQLASWVLEAGLPHCPDDGGLKRLLAEGTSFDECTFAHGCSETVPGHATLGTGAPARASRSTCSSSSPALGGKQG